MKQFCLKEKLTRMRITAVILAVAIVSTCVPISSWASTQRPALGNDNNAALGMGVINNGVDYTATYKQTRKIEIEAGKSGSFEKLYFGDSNTYHISGTVTITSYVESYGSIRLRLASGKDGEAMRYVEVCVRPQKERAILFLYRYAGTGTKEVAKKQVTNLKNISDEMSYTASYANGKVSFWLGDQQIFDEVNVTQGDNALSELTLAPGFFADSCSGTLSNIQIWGDVDALVAPQFDDKTDSNIIGNVMVSNPFSGQTHKLSSGSLNSNKNVTGRADFLGIVMKGDYTFYTDATFSDNKDLTSGGKEYSYEGIIFRIASVVKDNTKYVIELRVRHNKDVLIYQTLPNGTKEVLLENISGANPFDIKHEYIVNFHKNGTVDFWRNGLPLLYKYDLVKLGYTNIQPMFGIGCEVCNFSLENMILVNKDVYIEPSVPAKPEGNGDYADTMQVSSNSVVKYENGTVYSTTNATTATALFEYLPFAANETYVYGFDIEVEQTDKNWKGPRIIFAKDKDGKSYALFVTANSLIVARGDKEIAKVPFVREANKKYRIDLLVEPDAVTVWLNNVLQMEKCTTPNKDKATTGILFENAIARMSDIDLYYTTFKTYVAPVIPKKPVLKNITTNQYNAADWMSVLLAGKQYGGYFNNKLSSTDDSAGYLYTFEDLPITDEMSYYYSATYNVERSTANWKGPRFIIRKMGENPIYVAVTQASILVLAGSESVASAPLKLEFGKDYNIVMYSTPTTLSVWINNECVLENIDLSEYGKLSAKMGLLFELCRAKVTSIAIYGDKVVFDPNYVDEELYNSVYYKMDGIPKMTGTNLFQNIRMIDRSGGSIGASFDAQNNIFITEYKNGVGDVSFVDAKGSNNLNGLKNESGYVFSFTHKVDGWEADSIGQSGVWFTLNSSSVPSTSTSNTIALGISGDAVMLRVLKEDKELLKETIPFSRQNGKEYNFSVVHGKNWIKLFVDNELKMVCTNLPTYNVDFACKISNVASTFHNFKLYEFEDSGLSILETAVNSDAIPAGKTIYDAQEYDFPIVKNWPVTTIVIAALITFNSAIGIGLVILGTRKKRQVAKESQEV